MIKQFVSRGGEKLAFALKHFGISIKSLRCADFGSSTGGFTDCLLQEGARRIYAVDTAYGELAWRLRNESKVVVLERTNALHVKLSELVDFISVDCGWTRQDLILPNVFANLKPEGLVISLLKPHYEGDLALTHGKLSDKEVEEVVAKVIEKVKNIPDCTFLGVVESPITGLRGKNREFLLFLQKK